MQRRKSNGFVAGLISKYAKSISDIGIDYSIIARTKSIAKDGDDDDIYDDKQRESHDPYEDMSYESKRDVYRKFASYNEIEYILDSVCDDSIIPDEFGMACSINIREEKLLAYHVSVIKKNFEQIYSMLKFDQSNNLWKKFRSYLVDGAIAYEIVYEYEKKSEIMSKIESIRGKIRSVNESISYMQNDVKRSTLIAERKREERALRKYEEIYNLSSSMSMQNGEDGEDVIPVKIIGFVELDPAKLEKITDNESGKVYWFYAENGSYLSDNQVIRISYYDESTSGNVSYVERLIRNFNLKRKLEDSTVGWFIMNSQYKLKMVIPIANKTRDKAKEALRKVTNNYQEDLFVNAMTGEVTINGEPRINYSRNIVFPNRNGQSPQVDVLQSSGPDLSSMKVVDYFNRALRKDSRIPLNRYDRDQSNSRAIIFKADSVTYEDMSYANFINRIRASFSEVLKKPIYIQSLLDCKDLVAFQSLKSSIGFTFNTNFLFEESRQAEIMRARYELVKNYENIKGEDGGMLFSQKFLYVTKFKVFTEEEWEENERIKEAEKSKEKQEG